MASPNSTIDILNTKLKYEQAAEIHHWNVWTVDKKLCKSLFVIREFIQCATAR